LLVPTFFTFIASFCGVVVPYPALPHFWQSWMYWLTPFHYLLEGFVGVITHNVPVRCIDREESRFSTPAGMSCQDYAGSFAEKAGGYVRDAGNGMCSFCQYSTGNQYVSCPASSSSLFEWLYWQTWSMADQNFVTLCRLRASMYSTRTSGEIMWVSWFVPLGLTLEVILTWHLSGNPLGVYHLQLCSCFCLLLVVFARR
jgi:ABC-type multidrug transport system permease subunit